MGKRERGGGSGPRRQLELAEKWGVGRQEEGGASRKPRERKAEKK